MLSPDLTGPLRSFQTLLDDWRPWKLTGPLRSDKPQELNEQDGTSVIKKWAGTSSRKSQWVKPRHLSNLNSILTDLDLQLCLPCLDLRMSPSIPDTYEPRNWTKEPLELRNGYHETGTQGTWPSTWKCGIELWTLPRLPPAYSDFALARHSSPIVLGSTTMELGQELDYRRTGTRTRTMDLDHQLRNSNDIETFTLKLDLVTPDQLRILNYRNLTNYETWLTKSWPRNRTVKYRYEIGQRNYPKLPDNHQPYDPDYEAELWNRPTKQIYEMRQAYRRKHPSKQATA
jgi:hypothetical protein